MKLMMRDIVEQCGEQLSNEDVLDAAIEVLQSLPRYDGHSPSQWFLGQDKTFHVSVLEDGENVHNMLRTDEAFLKNIELRKLASQAVAKYGADRSVAAALGKRTRPMRTYPVGSLVFY